MSSKRRTETKRGNLTPIIVGSVVAIVIIFFIAVFALQPSAEKNFFGGEINVDYGLLAAMICLFIIPIFLITYLLQNQLLRGVTFGTIKK